MKGLLRWYILRLVSSSIGPHTLLPLSSVTQPSGLSIGYACAHSNTIIVYLKNIEF